MRLSRLPVIIAAFLIIAVSAPQSLFSQTSPRKSQSKNPQHADALAVVINELLRLDPLAPNRTGEYVSITEIFIFTPLIELPELILRNNDFWVDSTAGKIWVTYRGQLLRIPLPGH